MTALCHNLLITDVPFITVLITVLLVVITVPVVLITVKEYCTVSVCGCDCDTTASSSTEYHATIDKSLIGDPDRQTLTQSASKAWLKCKTENEGGTGTSTTCALRV